MRVLVFAHVPPPPHGQSYMVQMMLENLGKTNQGTAEDIVLFHVNAQLSDGIADIGVWRSGKFFRLAGYILQALWMRWRHSLEVFYYVPAPAKRIALYRDWLVLFLAAPFFKLRIFHWHATGLGPWVIEGASAGGFRRLEAWITRKLHSRHELSCVLNEWGRADVEVFSPPRIAVVANGIPDPCPDFASALLPERVRRLRQRSADLEGSGFLFQLLHLAHATRTKGLFDAVEAVSRANATLAKHGSGSRICLTVAGAFVSREEERAFLERIGRDDLRLPGRPQGEDHAVIYAGFADPQEKDRLLRESDALCFASYFPNEGQPVAVIEALAYGMPVILSRWRALPDILPASLSYLVEPADPEALAKVLPLLFHEARFPDYRQHYLDHYTLAAYCEHLRAAFLSIGGGLEAGA